MYVCIIARGLPTEKYKMNGIFEYDQAKALAKSGTKVVYIALDLRSIRRWRRWGISRTIKDEVIIYNVNVPVGGVPDSVLCRIGRWALNIAFKKVVKENGMPEVVHAHFVQQAYMASSLKEKYGMPFVVTEHSDDVNKQKVDDDVYKIAKMAYAKADVVLSVSEALRENLKAQFGIETKVVSNIINFDCFKLTRREKEEKFTFISVGGLVQGKRMDLLIDGFYHAFGVPSDVRLIIFGEGPERRKLEDKIQGYGLQNCIILRGLQERNAIYEEMKECQCFVLPSEAETFGVSYVEAMITGLPVIATKCGGPEEFVNEDNGILIRKNDVDELAAALIKMRSMATEYDSKSISEYVQTRYSNESVVTKLMKIYEEVKVIG